MEMVGASIWLYLRLIPSHHGRKSLPATSLMHAVFRKTRTNHGFCHGRRNLSINQCNITVLPNGVVQAIAHARNSSPLFVSIRELHKNKVLFLGLMIWYKVFHSIPFHPKYGGWIPLEVTFPWTKILCEGTLVFRFQLLARATC